MARSHVLKGFDDLDAALWLHNNQPGLPVAEMVEAAQANGLVVNDTRNFEAAQVLHEWGLADKKDRRLTDDGKAFYRLWQTRRSDAVDVLHGLQYGLWTQHRPSEDVASWAYRTVCTFLWHRNTLPDSSNALERYVHDQRGVEESIPPDIGQAFSNKSVNDVYDWLLPLEPPVLHGVVETGAGRQFRSATFQRRPYCSTSLFLMALAWLAREESRANGDLLMMDDSARARVCAFSLIEEEAFEPLLDATVARFREHLQVQTGYGTYVTVNRPPRLSDFLA